MSLIADTLAAGELDAKGNVDEKTITWLSDVTPKIKRTPIDIYTLVNTLGRELAEQKLALVHRELLARKLKEKIDKAPLRELRLLYLQLLIAHDK
jgi:hypothetical protein